MTSRGIKKVAVKNLGQFSAMFEGHQMEVRTHNYCIYCMARVEVVFQIWEKGLKL